MAKFVYKFKSILKVKESLQKKVQKEIALIDIDIDRLNNEYNSVSNEEDESKKSILKKDMFVSELKFKKSYELCLERKKITILEQIETLNKKKVAKLAELLQKSKEHKIFDSLEEVYRDNYKKEENRSELKFIDELATQKFIRQTK
jgi:flagellar export protein FliJ